MSFIFAKTLLLNHHKAAKVSNKHSGETKNKPTDGNTGCDTTISKMTKLELTKAIQVYPPWLNESCSLKQLPGIYQGVLGQVQLQSEWFTNGNDSVKVIDRKKLMASIKHSDYMNKFTDTDRVHRLLSASRLSNEHLATIWAHVNKTFPGKLTNREVCLALALIAIFQRIEREGGQIQFGSKDKYNPFMIVKTEKKPPVPMLHSDQYIVTANNTNDKRLIQKSASKDELLIDFSTSDETNFAKQNRSHLVSRSMEQMCNITKSHTIPLLSEHLISITSVDPLDLIDSDCDRFSMILLKLAQIWLDLMKALKSIFKRSFDVLNVEHGRQSALEALGSERGQDFSKYLCLCYPMAHNIKQQISDHQSIQISSSKQVEIFDIDFLNQTNDMMVSINEYWAVLINLLHESGQTNFIEFIMDHLNKSAAPRVRTIAECVREMDAQNNPDVCSICCLKSYLHVTDHEKTKLGDADLDLIGREQGVLITRDQTYHYHPRCANLWMNNVSQSDELPFDTSAQPTDSLVLKPN